MSKLDDLINKLCPDGVVFKTLGEVAKIKNGSDYKHLKKGEIPVYGSGGIMTYVDTYSFNKPSVLIPRKGSLKNLFYVDTPFWNVDTIFYTDINTTIICPKYLYYYLKTQHLEELNLAGGVPSLTQGVLNKVEIPIPPLEIQNEIVRILDNFTELEEELEEELEARRKQYEYYRDSLLTFDDSVEWKTIKELFNTRNGYTPSTSNSSFWDNGTIPWFVMDDIRTNGRILSESKQHITPAAVKGSGLFKKNSIIVATSATIGEHALITTDFLSNQRFTCLYPKEEFESKIDMKFIYYYSFLLDDFCKNNTTVSSFASVDMKKFYDFKFPIPSLDEQKRIVSILDRFDELTTNITSGLPAEIEARHKQYEYYRDKLLTFKRKSA